MNGKLALRSVFVVTLFFTFMTPQVYGETKSKLTIPPLDQTEFVGSEKCGSCHQIHYKGWVKTFHSTVIQDARKNPEAILGDFSDPNLPFDKGDIWYTIGGHWDQRYLTKIDDDFYVLPRLWSVQSKKWRPYSTWAWKKRPYSKYCAGCHAVAYNPVDKTYAEHTIGCEACHGPGKNHARDPSGENIVNPKKLDGELAEMICASCHVRGKDPTGQYYYPLGYKPGEDIAKYLVPLEKMAHESFRDAVIRLWRNWKIDRENQARSRCEVCGIHQKNKAEVNKRDVNSFCIGCHEIGDQLEEHTHHRADVEISCVSCHKQKVSPMKPTTEGDVHSYSYFLVHPLNCWDKDIYKQCGSCHVDKSEEWAAGIYNEWRSLRATDH